MTETELAAVARLALHLIRSGNVAGAVSVLERAVGKID